MGKPLAHLIGDKKLIAKLEKLARKFQRRIEKKVLRAGATPIKKAIKKEVPVDEGHLKKSIDFKLTGKGAAIIGPRGDYYEDGESPANYSHLVEYGYTTEDGKTVPGKHPIERGYKAAEATSAAKMNAKAESEINKLL